MTNFMDQQSALAAYRYMARSERGFAILMQRLHPFCKPDLAAEILCAPGVPMELRAGRLPAWTEGTPKDRFALRCPARQLAAAERYGKAVAGFDMEMKHFTTTH